MTTLYNAGPRSAYQAGRYVGTTTIDELRQHGNFGLGALDHNDGELVVLDGEAHGTDADGATTRLPGSVTTPYATVLPFVAQQRFEIERPMSAAAFQQRLGYEVDLHNRIWAIKITGRFASVTAGAGRRQDPPFRPLAEVFAEYELTEHHDLEATLVGFHCPVALTGINFVGAHYHLLDHAHARGGHVTDHQIVSATVELCEATSFHVDLPTDAASRILDLTPFH